jgi:glucosamine--fructose-6-phosphate aminotransferase (isomerizing)
MCGILGYIGKNHKAGKIILEGLKELEYRGYDSWGVAVKTKDGRIYIEKHTGKIGQATLPDLDADIGIGHTRWATHGGVTEANSHPHTDCSGDVIIVHNGIFENYHEQKQWLTQKGHTFTSETDSEVIAHLIEDLMSRENDSKKAVISAFKQMKGLNAIVVFFPKEEKIYAIKNSAPLVFAKTEHEVMLTSDASGLRPFTDTVCFLDDNELVEMAKNMYRLYTIEGEQKTAIFTTLQYSRQEAELGTFKDFTSKEIHEQPKVLRNIISTQKDDIIETAEIIKKAYGTYFIGCGTAHYASLASAYIFSKIAKRHVNCWSASEFSYLIDFLKDTSLVVAFSQSGETIDVISSIKEAKVKQAKIMAITNVEGSTLYRTADYKLLLSAGPEKSVVSTKVFTAWIGLIYLIAYQLINKYDQGIEELTKAIYETEAVLTREPQIEKLAQTLKKNEHLFILGRGLSYVAALESALKIKEASYIHAEGLAGGDLKHGPIALIDKGTPVIIFNPEDETYDDTLSSANEVKARGAYLIGISSKPNALYDEYIEVKHCNDATFIPNIVVAQLLGYHLAIAKGLDPDKPRNLAKSVTVK